MVEIFAVIVLAMILIPLAIFIFAPIFMWIFMALEEGWGFVLGSAIIIGGVYMLGRYLIV